jgi:hypothetical protein
VAEPRAVLVLSCLFLEAPWGDAPILAQGSRAATSRSVSLSHNVSLRTRLGPPHNRDGLRPKACHKAPERMIAQAHELRDEMAARLRKGAR